MLATVTSPSVAPRAFLPCTSCGQSESSPRRSLVGAESGGEVDELSLSQSGELTTNGAISEQMSLKAWTRSETGVTSDGDVWATSHTKLRFAYDFQTADGDTIQIRLQANLKYAQLTDSDAETQATRLRAAIHISVLQQDVASGLAPLGEAPETSAEAIDGLSQALELFQQVTDTATSLFLDGDPLDGDSLITSVVDAFNELSESLRSVFFPAADDATATSPETGEISSEVSPPSMDPETSLPAEFAGDETDSAVDIGSETSPEAASPEAVPTSDAETASAEDAVLTETEEQAEAADGQNTAPTTVAQPQAFVRSVMLRVRLQVIDSLRSLTDVFEGGSSGQQISRSTLRLSAQYSAYSRLATADQNNALPGVYLDAQG